MEDRTKKLEGEIKVLEDMGETELANKKRAELARLTGKKPTPVGEFSVGEDEWDAAKSKFATPGKHLSEFGMPDWHTMNKSIDFPFTIVDGGPDDGKESKISTGVSGKAVGILKQYLLALGIQPEFPITLAKIQQWVPGKRAYTFWVEQVDKRSIEEGGKGTVYTKAISILPLGAETTEIEDLGI